MSASKFFLVFLASFAAGATAAILLAPDSGKVTRKKLQKSLRQLGEEIVPVLQDIQFELDQGSALEERGPVYASQETE